MLPKKMGRPIGSKDTKPRRQKHAADTSIPFYPATTILAASDSKSDVILPFCSPGDTVKRHGSLFNADQIQKESVQLPRCACLLMESTDGTSYLDNRSLLEDEQEEKHTSIDDQLHSWAQCGSHWIIDVPLDGDKSWDRAPSVL